MKLAMKLRTRLFLSISALMTVALLGLLLGLVSVMQMAKSQESLIRDNFITLDLGLKLRQSLGDQLVIMLSDSEKPDQGALQASREHYRHLLQEGIEHEQNNHLQGGFAQAQIDYESFLQAFDSRGGQISNSELANSLNTLRYGLLTAHKRALEEISSAESSARNRAMLICGLLGLVALAVLIIGFITAHGIAQRFGAPIEALAKAAGQGNFEVTLPISSAAEMNQLTRRFGIMAEALRQHQATNVDELLAGQQLGHLEHLNPVAQRQLGWDAEQLGQGLGDALGRPELDEQLSLILRGGSLERAPEDESRLLTYSLTPVSHPQGHILGAVMVLHDVTEQRAFERVRSEFVLRASHELRTPVTGMHMAFGLLQERVHFDAESREADLLNTVKEEMQRLMQLINDLLNFSRYQNGLQKLTLAPCDIGQLLEQARERFAEQASRHSWNGYSTTCWATPCVTPAAVGRFACRRGDMTNV